ncbi:basal body-orientation factor 1 [Grus japonensis]|uniref:Basal body-orientation factor 1 n=1 Tax=Grus japonensis TaxID=30415 RepID=A0ABC9WZ36_GRUJA
MVGGRRSLRCSGSSCSRRSTAAGQAPRVPEEKLDEVDAALREARLAATEASRAENREATRRLATSDAQLLWPQQDAEREAAAVTAFLTKQGQEKAEEIEKLKQELIDLKQQAQEEKKKLADYYAQQIKELEEKFQKKVGEIGQIQLELKLIKEFHREKAAMEKELEDETSEGLIQKKILQINRQKAQIGELQRKVEKLEMALCRMTRESVQKKQHQALIENQASLVEMKKLQQLLEMKDREMNRVKKLAWNILNERTEVEREKIQFEKVDISELTWEQKERVLRLLFAKMNGTNPW